MFLKEGFDGFVSKPIEIEELERVMKQVLPKSSISFIDAEAEKEIIAINEAVPEPEPGPESEKDVIAVLKKSGIDTDAGIKYCVGDTDFYKSLLIQFSSEAADKIASMKQYFLIHDWHNYEILVHALKSTSKMIGVTDLSEKAKALEMAAKSSNEEFILNNHNIMIQDYGRISGNIREHLLGDGNDDEEVFEFEPENDGGDEV